MTDRISSGVQRLDAILGGGLPGNAISLIIGLPGTGKTIFAQQFVFTNARPRRPALYFSTVSEPLEKILRYGQPLTFFDSTAVGKTVFYEDLGKVANDNGLSGVLDCIRGQIRERRPSIVVIDSFKALHAYAADLAEFRQFLHNLAGMLGAYPVSTLWLGEYGGDEIAVAPEFAVADAIIALESIRIGMRTSRALQILKLRGGDYRSGSHAYRLSTGGITVLFTSRYPADPHPLTASAS